jgi:hypothetical protein
MDETRRLRFLVPPFFTFGSVALGAYFAGVGLDFKGYPIDKLISIGAALAASSIPLGFFITSASIVVLRVILTPFVSGPYEAHLSDETRKRLWPKLRSELPADKKWDLYAAATFDHELLATGINGWLQRRWMTFNLSVHCIAAAVFAHVVGRFLQIPLTVAWAGSTVTVSIVFLINAIIAWRQTMTMIEFQASRVLSSDSADLTRAKRPAESTE